MIKRLIYFHAIAVTAYCFLERLPLCLLLNGIKMKKVLRLKFLNRTKRKYNYLILCIIVVALTTIKSMACNHKHNCWNSKKTYSKDNTVRKHTFHVTFRDWSPVGWTDSSLGGPDGARKIKQEIYSCVG